MATLIDLPEGTVPNPLHIDYSMDWREQGELYIQRVREWVETQSTDEWCGYIIKFPAADGYAMYMIVDSEQETIVHLALGDAWTIPHAHLRGLDRADLVQQARAEEAVRLLFG
jgi:hypothetical protein